jgi:hypothetical protein
MSYEDKTEDMNTGRAAVEAKAEASWKHVRLSGEFCYRCNSTHLVLLDVVEPGNADSSRVSVRACGGCGQAWCVADEGVPSGSRPTQIAAVIRALHVAQEMNQGLPFKRAEPQRKTIALSKECLENLDILMRSR